MPAPQPAQIKMLTLASFQQLGTGGTEFLDIITAAIAQGWTKWALGLSWGNLTLTGAGVGAWSGAGVGGKISGSDFELPAVNFQKNSPENKKLVEGLADALPKAFTMWMNSFQFAGLQFTGASTATPTAPGTFTAANIPVPMIAAGTGQAPSAQPLKLADAWALKLTSPTFDLNHPKSQTKKFIGAISGAIEQAFDTVWLTGAQATGGQASGPATPAGVVAGVASLPGGKIV